MYFFVDGHVCSEDRIRNKHAYVAVAREMARWHAMLPLANVATRDDAMHKRPGIWSTTAKWVDAIPERAKAWGIDKDKLRGEFEYVFEKLMGGGGGVPDPKEPMVRTTPLGSSGGTETRRSTDNSVLIRSLVTAIFSAATSSCGIVRPSWSSPMSAQPTWSGMPDSSITSACFTASWRASHLVRQGKPC